MKNEKLLNAIGKIDDEIIYAAEPKGRRAKRLSVKKAIALVAAVMIVFTLSIPALAAANFEPAYNILYMLSPTIAQKLKPVRMSCEYSGIKFDVVSAYVEDDEAKIFVSVRDLDANRIDETTDLFDSYSINTPFDCSSSCENISYDAETKTATFLISITQWDKQDIIGDKITFNVRELLSNKQKYDAALHDLDLSEISNTPDTISPAFIFGGGGINFDEAKDDFCVLEPADTIYSPVEGVDITAMGYVDGNLHIQIRYENVLKTDNHGYIYFKNNNGEEIKCIANIYFAIDIEQQEHYVEYIYDLSNIELAEYHPYGHFVTSDTLITGNWSVTFPLESVKSQDS